MRLHEWLCGQIVEGGTKFHPEMLEDVRYTPGVNHMTKIAAQMLKTLRHQHNFRLFYVRLQECRKKINIVLRPYSYIVGSITQLLDDGWNRRGEIQHWYEIIMTLYEYVTLAPVVDVLNRY